MSTEHASVRTSRSPRRRRRVRRLSGRDRLVLTLMIGVPVLLEAAFIWGPAVSTVFLSFTDAHGAAPTNYVGAQNYTVLRTIDPQFWPAVRHNVIWLLEFTVVATPLGILIAVLIDRGIRGSRVYQSIFFLPVMLSLALIGIVWQIVYSPQFGLINGVLGRTTPNDAINWLGNPKLNLWAVLVEATWRQAGYVMVLYLAGLKAVDPGLEGSGCARRRVGVEDVLARHAAHDAADQQRGPGRHGDRVAARVRPGLRHQRRH